jgi:hypothetical protein
MNCFQGPFVQRTKDARLRTLKFGFKSQVAFKNWIKENITKENIKTFFILMMCQFSSYVLITINFRAISQGKIFQAETTDAANATLGYFLIKKIAKDDSHFIGWLGYLIGSLLGTYVGILLSVWFSGK